MWWRGVNENMSTVFTHLLVKGVGGDILISHSPGRG